MEEFCKKPVVSWYLRLSGANFFRSCQHMGSIEMAFRGPLEFGFPVQDLLSIVDR